jgi:hypothetical protein
VRIDGLCVGIRLSDDRLDGILDAALRSLVVPDVEAPPNLSVVFGKDHGSAHGFHVVYRRGARVARAASMRRLVQATLAQLDGFTEVRPGTTRLHARILCHTRGVVLIDPTFAHLLETLERRLSRHGLYAIDAPHATIDHGTLDVLTGIPRFGLDASTLAELDRRFPPPVREEVPDVGTRPVLASVVVCDQDLSPAQRLARLAPFARDDEGRITRAGLDAVIRLTRSRPVVYLPPTIAERELLDVLARLPELSPAID